MVFRTAESRTYKNAYHHNVLQMKFTVNDFKFSISLVAEEICKVEVPVGQNMHCSTLIYPSSRGKSHNSLGFNEFLWSSMKFVKIPALKMIEIPRCFQNGSPKNFSQCVHPHLPNQKKNHLTVAFCSTTKILANIFLFIHKLW